MTNETNLQEKFPFLTGMSYNGKDYVGIVQNKDNQIISFYDIDNDHISRKRNGVLPTALIFTKKVFAGLTAVLICHLISIDFF